MGSLEDLYKIVTEANREIEKQMKAYYASLLGIRKKPKKEKQEKPDIDTKVEAPANGTNEAGAAKVTGNTAESAASQDDPKPAETSEAMVVDGQEDASTAHTAAPDQTAEVTNDIPSADMAEPGEPTESTQPATSAAEASAAEADTAAPNGVAKANTPPTVDQGEAMEVSQ